MTNSPYLVLARPHHYSKNLFVLSPLFFGRLLTDVIALKQALLAFIVFCLAASSVYVFNDICDIAYDRLHPTKKNRPLASGQISVRQALVFASILLTLSLSISFGLLKLSITSMLLAYIGLNILYSLGLKKIAIVDIHCIAIGFVLRIWAGGFAVGLPISNWLIIVTFLLALFFALSKRRDELLAITENATTRPSITGYSLEFVMAAMVIMAGVVIVCYILYTVSPEITGKHGSDKLYYTIFWVILGFLRYMQITFVYQKQGSPTELLFRDPFLLAIGICWMVHYLFIFYL